MLKKILFNEQFVNVIKKNNKISFSYKNEKYEIENKKITPHNPEIIKILGIKENSVNVNTNREEVIEENPFLDLANKKRYLSWTGSAGVDKFISCPRMAYYSFKRQRKIFSDKSKSSMEIGTLLHEYVLRHSFSSQDERELFSYFLHRHSVEHPSHKGIDVVNIVNNTRNQLFNIFDKLGEEKTIRFEEQGILDHYDLRFIQYVDAYAFSIKDEKMKVIIVDLKTSSRKGVKEMSYWGQLLYYRYNLRKKLAKEFKILEENIEFETHILWIFYKAPKKYKYNIKQKVFENGVKVEELRSSKIMSNTSKEILFKNSKFRLPLCSIIAYKEIIVSFYDMKMQKEKDDTMIMSNEINLTMEHEEYLEEDMKKASIIIHRGIVKPNYHSCNKNAWGCDYESICHFKTKVLKGKFKDKQSMKDEMYENLDDEVIRVSLKTW